MNGVDNWQSCRNVSVEGVIKPNYYIFADGCEVDSRNDGQYYMFATATVRRADYNDFQVTFDPSNTECGNITNNPTRLEGTHFYGNYPTSYSGARTITPGGSIKNYCYTSTKGVWTPNFSQCVRCRTRLTGITEQLP